MGCAEPPSKGVRAPHQHSRVNKKRSGGRGGGHVRVHLCYSVFSLSFLFVDDVEAWVWGDGCIWCGEVARNIVEKEKEGQQQCTVSIHLSIERVQTIPKPTQCTHQCCIPFQTSPVSCRRLIKQYAYMQTCHSIPRIVCIQSPSQLHT